MLTYVIKAFITSILRILFGAKPVCVPTKTLDTAMLNVGNRQREQQEHTYGGSFELSMYDQPPCVEVTLEDFEQFAISRLHGTHHVTQF